MCIESSLIIAALFAAIAGSWALSRILIGPLYKYLIRKGNHEITVLATVSLIFLMLLVSCTFVVISRCKLAVLFVACKSSYLFCCKSLSQSYHCFSFILWSDVHFWSGIICVVEYYDTTQVDRPPPCIVRRRF